MCVRHHLALISGPGPAADWRSWRSTQRLQDMLRCTIRRLLLCGMRRRIVPRTLTTLRTLWLTSQRLRRGSRLSPPSVYRLFVVQVDVVIVPIVDDPTL